MNNVKYLSTMAACLIAAGSASGATLFSDDLTSGANFTAVGTSDFTTTFGFDYSTVGIPAAPGSADTLGLRTAVNVTAGAANSVAVVTNSTFSGVYTVEFDMWINYTGPLELGGAGSTEFAGGVVGHDGSTSGFGASGAVLAFTGDAGAGTDLSAHEDGVQQDILFDGGFNPALTGMNHPNIDTELGLFPSVTAPAAQVSLFPAQIEATRAGAAGFAWRHFTINVDETAGTAEYIVDGVTVITMDANDGSSFNPAGRAGVLHADTFSSLAGDVNMAFALFDNFEITDGASGLVGDLNSDGFVGIDDLNIVLGNWNLSVPPANPLADPSGDNFVGIDDLNQVLGNWNAGTPPTGGAAVPEPASLALLSLGGVAMLRRRR